MAVGPIVIPQKADFNFVNATNLLAANPANFKLMLVGSGWVPNNATDEVIADIGANEIAAGNGYTAGGTALTNVSLALVAGKAKFTCDPVVFNGTGAGFPAWRRGVYYYNGTLNGKVNPIVGHFLGDAAPADVPATTPANSPLTITPNAAGLLTVG
jgi:hypothetical protein